MRRAGPSRLLLCALALACGRADERAASETTIDLRPSAERPATPSVAAPAAAGGPAALAEACVAGDPELGLPWSLRGVADSALPVTGLDSLAPRDSARLVVRIARTVDVLPSDTTVADFRGLPVVVRAAWRLVPAAGDTVVVALVARRLPLESSPLEEVFALVAAPGQRQGVRDPLIEGWVTRDVGSEESLPMRELAGAFRAADTVRLALVHEMAEGVQAELLARVAGRWTMAWRGVVPLCSPR